MGGTRPVLPSVGARHRVWYVLAVLGCFALIWPVWLPWVGLGLVVRDPMITAEALVPMAGGDNRIREAIRLYHEGYAERILLTDMGQVAPTDQVVSLRNRYLAQSEGGVPLAHLYTLDRRVRSTYTELEAVRDLAQREGWQSLILVTSPQHTRRTRLIADRVFAHSDIVVSVQPVRLETTDLARWWVDPDERRMTLLEYPKILALLVGYRGR
ncbi:MAG: YdcF family protein [Oscillochloridaceae bacterium umkhey_bin13]